MITKMPKFRAWDKFDKVMREVTLLDYNHNFVGYSYPVFMKSTMHMELMQSTGLFDKKGVEIFEGDIVKRDGVKRPEVVRFGEWTDVDSLGYKEQYIGFYFESEHEGQEWLHSVQPQFNHLYKVIGNIYENQELLENEGMI